MSTIYPLAFDWDGEAMIPLNGPAADRQYVIGERYRLAPHEDSSTASRNHYFASVEEAWKNLPEDQADRFPTFHHLRKWALIRAGYRDERTMVADSKAEAQKLAAFIKPMDDYAVVVVRECTVAVYTAKSQKMKAMGRKDFQESKDRVLDVLSGLIGVSTDELKENTARAA